MFLHCREDPYLFVQEMGDVETLALWQAKWKRPPAKRAFKAFDRSGNLRFVKLQIQDGSNWLRAQRLPHLLSSTTPYLPLIVATGSGIHYEDGLYDYQCLEYFHSQSLQELLPLKPGAAIRIFYLLARAVEDLHRPPNAMVHRNLQPAHILIDPMQNMIKLAGLTPIKRDNAQGMTLSSIIGCVDLSEDCEVVGFSEFVPFDLLDKGKPKDVFSIASIFVYSIIDKERRPQFLKCIQKGISCEELDTYLPSKHFPEILRTLLQKILVERRMFRARDLAEKFSEAAGYDFNGSNTPGPIFKT